MTKRKDRPTKRQRADALRVLHAVAINDSAPDHARVSAARAIINDDPDEAAADAKAAAGPPAILVMPTNGRDPGLTPLGITRSAGCWTIHYDSGTPEGIAALERWQAELAAELDVAYPPPPLALPSPAEKPKALTNAERQRRRRERLKSAKATDRPAV
jgi:hypothetical protein